MRLLPDEIQLSVLLALRDHRTLDYIHAELGVSPKTARALRDSTMDINAEIERLTAVCRALGKSWRIFVGGKRGLRGDKEPARHYVFGEMLTTSEVAEVAGMTYDAMLKRLRTMSASQAIRLPRYQRRAP